MIPRIHSNLQHMFRQFLMDSGFPMIPYAPIEHKGDDESFLTESLRFLDGNSWNEEGEVFREGLEVPEDAVVYGISVPYPVEVYEAPESMTLYAVVGRYNGETCIIATDADPMEVIVFALRQKHLRAE